LTLINYETARHPKFQAQADGWGSGHDKWLPYTWDSSESRKRNKFVTYYLNYL
jgi:hypothetical protein